MDINKAVYPELDKVRAWTNSEIRVSAVICRDQAKYLRTQGDDSGIQSEIRQLRHRAVQLDNILRERRNALKASKEK